MKRSRNCAIKTQHFYNQAPHSNWNILHSNSIRRYKIRLSFNLMGVELKRMGLCHLAKQSWHKMEKLPIPHLIFHLLNTYFRKSQYFVLYIHRLSQCIIKLPRHFPGQSLFRFRCARETNSLELSLINMAQCELALVGICQTKINLSDR